MSHPHEKCSEETKVWLGETLKSDLMVQAAKEGFDSLSPFVRKILRGYMYGHHGSEQRDLLAGTVRG